MTFHIIDITTQQGAVVAKLAPRCAETVSDDPKLAAARIAAVVSRALIALDAPANYRHSVSDARVFRGVVNDATRVLLKGVSMSVHEAGDGPARRNLCLHRIHPANDTMLLHLHCRSLLRWHESTRAKSVATSAEAVSTRDLTPV